MAHPPPPDNDVDTELRFHFDETVEALIARGWTAADARAEAARRFGSAGRHRGALVRIDRTIQWRQRVRALFSFGFRDAFRSLRHAPLLTAVAILSVGLGVGANTALFSIVNGLMLRPLPVRDPGRLALVEPGSWTNPIYEQIRDRQAGLLAGALAWSNENFNLASAGQTDPVAGAYVSGSYFDVLGVGTVLGRTLTAADDRRGGGPDGAVAVLGYGMWLRRFGGAPDVIGRRLTVNQLPVTIVGVAPRGFVGTEIGRTSELFLPLATVSINAVSTSALDNRSNVWLNIMVRLDSGQTMESTALALNRWRPEIREATVPGNYAADARAAFLSADFTLVEAATGRSTLRQRIAQPLTIITIVVAGVLLIACANIANLMLARASARRHEMSLRLALGASRGRLVRQLLAEGGILAVAGSAAGLALALLCGDLLVRQLGTDLNVVSVDVSTDWRVLAFTSAVAIATTMFFGLVPAAGLQGVAPNDALKEHTRSVSGDRRFGVRNLLVVAQVALSLVLVIGAGLFVRTFYTLTTAPLGFSPERMVIANVDARRSTVAPADRLMLLYRVAAAAAATPGVEQAVLSRLTPLSGSGWNNRVIVPPDSRLDARERMTFHNAVAPGWLATYGMRLLAGRDVSPGDVIGSEPVGVVNETFAKRFIGGAAPVGHVVELGQPSGQIERIRVVGVVNDAIYRSTRNGVVPIMYLPLAQASVQTGFALTVKLNSDTRGATIASLSRALADVDSKLAFSFRDYDAQIRATVGQERLLAMLSGFFGGLALFLAALGLYGVTAYGVSRRRAEIAIRIALGADASDVVRMVLQRVTILLIAGTVIGLGLSVWASRFVGALLFRLDPRDPATFAGAIATLAVVGLVAGWLPARRAARIDPTAVLRD